MTNSTAIRITAVLGFLGVGLGAFGAHGLKSTLEAFGTEGIWNKAVLYHLVHAAAMLTVAFREPFAACAWRLWLAGVAIFSGSLYLLAVTNVKWLGAITPIGGSLLLAGWLVLAWRAGR